MNKHADTNPPRGSRVLPSMNLNVAEFEVMTSLAEQASKLLDFSQKFDVQLLDNIVNCMYSSSGQQQKSAQDVLTAFKEHPDAWTRVDGILEFSMSQQTKYYALQIAPVLAHLMLATVIFFLS